MHLDLAIDVNGVAALGKGNGGLGPSCELSANTRTVLPSLERLTILIQRPLHRMVCHRLMRMTQAIVALPRPLGQQVTLLVLLLVESEIHIRCVRVRGTSARLEVQLDSRPAVAIRVERRVQWLDVRAEIQGLHLREEPLAPELRGVDAERGVAVGIEHGVGAHPCARVREQRRGGGWFVVLGHDEIAEGVAGGNIVALPDAGEWVDPGVCGVGDGGGREG